MMYMPNRMEMFGEPPSLDEPSDLELGVLERLEKFSQIEIPSYRQQACVDIDEAMSVCTSKDDFERVRKVAIDLIQDQDLNVRVSLLDQFQFIGPHCVEKDVCKEIMFEFVTSALRGSLKDPNQQVRKSAQSSLIVLTNKGFYYQNDLKALFVDTIYEMMLPDPNVSGRTQDSYYTNSHELNDFPPEAITLIAALASHLGPEVVVQKYLDRYIELCSDMLLHVRKCCANSFPNICRVSGSTVVEQKLLPVFSQLCNDEIWGVRKACAESFTAISESIDQRARVQMLTPLFLQLLNDTSRYVKLAAYQQLGPFITTFQNTTEKDNEVEAALERERSPTNPEYDNFLFWKSPVDIDTEELEKELQGEEEDNKSAEEKSKEVGEKKENGRDAQALVVEEFTVLPSTEHIVNVESAECVQLKEEPTEYTSEDAEPTKESDVVVTMTSNVEKKMTDKIDKAAFNAMFHQEEEEEEAMQVEEGGVHLRNFFQSLLKDKESTECGDENKENKAEEEEVFDSNLSVSKSPDWGLTSPNNMSDFQKDPLSPKIIHLSDSGADQDKKPENIEDVEHDGSVLVGTIDITKPVFGVLDKEEDEKDLTYSFTHKEEDLELASDSSDMDIEPSTPALSSVSSPVPGALIDCYTNMANNIDEDHIRADDDILTHCAYAFPGVVYTLGKDSWSLLRNTYHNLAENLPHSMSNVRQTLACSLHEIAHVIGPELTQQDLIHPFNNFIYDIDKVKIGLLRNLSKFLEHVSDGHRQELLLQMKEIQKCEDRKNWRYRQTFAQQLPHLCSLYTTKEVYEHIQPIIINLTMDQVSEVRKASFIALSKLLHRFKAESADDYYNITCSNVMNKFANSNKCFYRQSYALIVLALLHDEEYEIVEKTFLPNLLELVTDRTPNVRIWVGQCLLILSNHMKGDKTGAALSQLQSDSDTDVRHYATHILQTNPMLSNN